MDGGTEGDEKEGRWWPGFGDGGQELLKKWCGGEERGTERILEDSEN